jgi:hypothetical protein
VSICRKITWWLIADFARNLSHNFVCSVAVMNNLLNSLKKSMFSVLANI